MKLRWTRPAAAAPAESDAPTGPQEAHARADASAVAHTGDRSRGQVLVIFALILTFLLLMSALVVDLAWLWGNTLRIQRAADAAALAGVVHLPGNPGLAYSTAVSEATKNGYVNGANSVTVSPIKDPYNARKLDVTVSAPVKTFFLGIIGMNQFTISRQADAEYILPVPMGSPQNYYGVG
ncbi:MAG: pilus assembly protein TadG-related protein, partial [Chloroflexota bacterium]|nr:pilus assembly protein TadG-related protein [Chloroflexota bacterium]